MARQRELKSYNVLYNDGTYQTMDFTKEDIARLEDALIGNIRAVKVNFGVLVTTDVRTVAEFKEPEKVEEIPSSQLTTGLPGGDMEINAYLRDLERLSEDAEYERRMLY